MTTAVAEAIECDYQGLADVREITEAFWAGLRPDPDETLDVWSDDHIHLPSHVAEPGRWRTSRTPFLREIMQCLSPRHPAHEVVLMKPTQVGGTQIAVNWVGYVIDRAPTVMMFTEPNREFASKLSDEKIQPMLDCTPCLKGKVRDARERDSGNTIMKKKFLGGFLVLAGVKSSISMRFTSAKYLVMDEIDAYPADVDNEGHPCDILAKRTATFPQYKLFKLSSPRTAELSRIEPDFKKGSRGRYHVPCPHCGHRQHLQWGNLVYTFDGVADPARAAYRCASCLELIPERYKTWMFDQGEWVHEDPDNPIRSFHFNLLYQPYGWAYPWSRLVEDWIEANLEANAGDTRKLKTFINTVLAETWEEKGEKVESHQLYTRREVYEAECPAGVLLLTAAVDVQDNRLEAEIVGWGRGQESWGIDYRVFPGSPSNPLTWQDLTEWLQEARRHAYGFTLRVDAVAVDTGGHHTKEAYDYVRTYRGRCYAIKGSNQHGAPVIDRTRRAKYHAKIGGKLHLIGTVAAKDTIFARMLIARPGPGYMHYPVKEIYGEDYFRMLTNEERKLHRDKRGVPISHYYEKKGQNEPLDIRVYNLAVVELRNPPWEKLAKWLVPVPQMALSLDEETGEAPELVGVGAMASEEEPKAQPIEPPLPKPTFVKKYQPPRRTGGFVQGWR